MNIKVMRTALVLTGALALALPGAAMAQRGGGGEMGAAAGMHGGVGMGASMGGFGGNSASNISASGMMNTNGPNATDRQFGTARASLRHQQHATNANATTSIGTNAGMAPNGGQSSAHISASGLANTNGPNATDRQTGTARATQRTQLNSSSSTHAHIPH